MIDPKQPDYQNTPVSASRAKYGYAPANPEAAPCVSILTPYYNAGDHFEDTARSVLQQSMQAFEWIIVNDRSTDPESLRVLDRYRHVDPRIRIIDCEENGGPSRARNIGYAAARTPYIAQIDADDLLEPTAVEKWFWFLETHPEVGFVKGYSLGFDAEEYLWTNGFHCNERFLQDNPVQPNSMIRKQVHADAGGYDEANRAGLEDWDFWLRCATAGHWGTTIPEYSIGYRRRETHSDRWDNWDSGSRQKEFLKELQRLYPHLQGDGFPKIPVRYSEPYENVPVDLPCGNKLAKTKPRLLMLVPWMTMGGSDKFSLDLLERLTKRGWEVTIAATRDGDNGWHHEFAKHTPDVFIARNLVTKADYPRFLQYLIESRQVDAVLTTHSCLGYQLLPFLRSRCPDVAYLDYCHIEEADWKNGGYPRFGVGYQEVLDLNVVSSQHLKRWMVERGGDPERIEVCYTGVDPTVWKPDAKARESFRDKIGVGQDEVMVLFAGRLHSQKQPRVLARTIVALAERGLEFRAVIAGDGEERGAFDGIIAGTAAANRVLMLGAISQDDMKRAMPAADIFFLPSKWEGIALSLFEAMSCGVAFVGAAVGGQRELVDSSCGCLIERSDEDREVAEYTELLDKLIRDRAYRECLSRAGRDRAETFSLDAMAEQMIACIDHAKKLANDAPRMSISQGLGRETAVAAIESTRLEALADSLWSERHNVSGTTTVATSVSRSPSQWRVVKRVKRMIKKRLPKLR